MMHSEFDFLCTSYLIYQENSVGASVHTSFKQRTTHASTRWVPVLFNSVFLIARSVYPGTSCTKFSIEVFGTDTQKIYGTWLPRRGDQLFIFKFTTSISAYRNCMRIVGLIQGTAVLPRFQVKTGFQVVYLPLKSTKDSKSVIPLFRPDLFCFIWVASTTTKCSRILNLVVQDPTSTTVVL